MQWSGSGGSGSQDGEEGEEEKRAGILCLEKEREGEAVTGGESGVRKGFPKHRQ